MRSAGRLAQQKRLKRRLTRRRCKGRRAMAKRDYYDVLGISRGARDSEIKAAFRRLAKECHPDSCNGDPNAEKRFKELNEAYEALKDPQRRAAYDRYGHAAFDPGLGGGAHREAAPGGTAYVVRLAGDRSGHTLESRTFCARAEARREKG